MSASLATRFHQAEKWLRHWQMTGGIGRPEEWRPLAFAPENYAEFLRRVAAAKNSQFFGTGQWFDIQAVALEVGAPPAAEPAAAPADAVPVVSDEHLAKFNEVAERHGFESLTREELEQAIASNPALTVEELLSDFGDHLARLAEHRDGLVPKAESHEGAAN